MAGIKEMSDIELGKVQGQMYQELIRIQGNLQAIDTELNHRAIEINAKPVKKGKK